MQGSFSRMGGTFRIRLDLLEIKNYSNKNGKNNLIHTKKLQKNIQLFFFKKFLLPFQEEEFSHFLINFFLFRIPI